jgi:NDP-sugar pyrophosphorylase family protein
VHRDIMDRRYTAAPFVGGHPGACVAPTARIEDGATIVAPCFIDEETIVKAGAAVGPYSVVGRHCHIEDHATVERSIVWADTRIGQEAVVRQSILGRHCHIGRNAVVSDIVLGDKSMITDYSRL